MENYYLQREEWLKNTCIMDDTFMALALNDKDAVKLILTIILRKEDLNILDV